MVIVQLPLPSAVAPPAAPANGEKPEPGKRKRRVQKLVRRVVARVGRRKTKVEQS